MTAYPSRWTGSLLALALLVTPLGLLGQQSNHEGNGTGSAGHQEAEESEPLNSLSLFLGHTVEHRDVIDEIERGFTFGLEYSRLVADQWRVGGVVERAGGEIKGTLVLAQLFYNPVAGLVLVTGPGAEYVDTRDRHEHGSHGEAEREDARVEFVYRIGVLYEFELERLILAPAVDVDFVGRDEALVFGVNVGYAF